MKPDLIDEGNQQSKVVERPGWSSLVVAASYVEDEAAIVGQGAVDLASERQEPLDIFIFVLIAVFFLEVKCIRRRRYNQIQGACRDGTEDIKGVAQISCPVTRPKVGIPLYEMRGMVGPCFGAETALCVERRKLLMGLDMRFRRHRYRHSNAR
jgi:hypothetical protein